MSTETYPHFCRSDNVVVNSNFMEYKRSDCFPSDSPHPDHNVDIYTFVSCSNDCHEHYSLINDDQLLKMVQTLSDWCVPDGEEHDSINNALRLLRGRAKEEATRRADLLK